MTRPGLAITVSVAALASAACPALAQESAAPAAPADSPVVVQGQRNEVTDRIDRRIYDFRNDPDAQSGNAGDILNKVPSVTVTPGGRVALRGDINVTVLVDGKPPINGNAFLQTQSAADIDRIEVITNPSAQFSANGTSGVINIITRKRHPFGLSGTSTVRLTSQGQVGGNASLSLTTGPWSLTSRLSAGQYPGLTDGSTVQTLPTASRTRSRSWFSGRYLGAELEVARKVGDHQTLTVSGRYYPEWTRTHATGDYSSVAKAFSTAYRATARDAYGQLEFLYDYNNDDKGRHITLDATAGSWNVLTHSATTDTYSTPLAGQAVYGAHTEQSGPSDDVKADLEQRFASGHLLTSGLEWKRDGSDEDDAYFDRGGIAGPHADGSTKDFSGTREVTSAYVTYQRPLAWGWTMLPGLRAEREDLDIRSQGIRTTPDAFGLYPSLHLSHALGQGKLKLSYSRRVDRQDIGRYDPSVTYVTPVYATQGNPGLKAPETDAYEAGYDFSKGKVSYDATVYYRALQNVVSDYSSEIGGGVVLQRPVNSGHSRSGGVEFTIKRPVSAHWKASLNTNLYYNTMPFLSGGVTGSRGAFTYSGNGTLQYDSEKGDEVQAVLTLTGRQLDLQGYTMATSRLDFTWRHDLSKKVSIVVAAFDVLGGMKTETVFQTPDLTQRYIQKVSDRILRISLTRKFGGPASK